MRLRYAWIAVVLVALGACESFMPGGGGGGGAADEEVLRSRISVMRFAVDAYLLQDLDGPADRVGQAMRARELSLEGRRDPDAQAVMDASPARAELARLLLEAGEYWESRGHEHKAGQLYELSGVYAGQARSRGGAAAPAGGDSRARISGLESRVRELEERLEGMEGALLEMRSR